MSKIQLDARAFNRRLRLLLSRWKQSQNTPDDLFQNADCLLVVVGIVGEEVLYQKSTALQTWLFGYEFPSTLLLLTKEKLHVVTTVILEGLKQGDKHGLLEVYKRTKNAEENAKIFQSIVEVIRGCNAKRIGVFPKDQFSGSFVNEWETAFGNSDVKCELVDVSTGMGQILAVKDEEEIWNSRMAAKLTSNMMKQFFVKEMSALIDEEKSITHDKFSEMIEETLVDERKRTAIRLPNEADADVIDWCYSPIVQSGGKFDLRSSAVSNKDLLHAGTILCSFGVRYKSYCSNIGRTYLIDPQKSQEKNYAFLLDLQSKMIEMLRPGTPLCDVYNKALGIIRAKRPDLEQHFVKNCGFSMGIEFRESAYVINAKNTRKLEAGMVINLSAGLQNLEAPNASDPKAVNYALLLVDTVLVTDNAPVLLTDCNKAANDISYFFKDDDDEGQSKDTSGKRTEPTRPTSTAVLKTKFRSEAQDDDSAEQRRLAHQKELAERRQREGIERFSEGKSTDASANKRVLKKFESYRRIESLPKGLENCKIVVDRKAFTVILPIYGLAVPFHLSTLKNLSKSDEGDYVSLRFNFVTPGQPGGKKDEQPFDDPNATFVRALLYRSADVGRFTQLYKDIMELKKDLAKKDAEVKEMEDIVTQARLIELGGPRIRLPNVFLRPPLEGKRVPGELQIHQNGLRYQSPLRSDQRIDLLFSNIKHLFFQPCDNELIVLLHVHLHNPVMVGKKKTKDVQFYREAADSQFDETGNRRRRMHYGDEDELEAEQEERRRRVHLNKEFKLFADRISDMSHPRVAVDVPFRDLGFSGVPFRSNVLLQPTTDCLIYLSDPPFLVITLADIEIAHLERVQFGLKNFDMVFVFKNFSQAPVHINAIPMAQLDNVKEWLNSVDVPFTEGPVNLNWPAIMKTINADPAAFFQEGGWSFLRGESDNEDDASSESASEFEMSGDDARDESTDYSDQDSEDAYSNSDDDDDDGGSDGFDGSEGSGDDWDELDRKAKEYDDRRAKRKESEPITPSRKKARR
ncbi:FACT complex subunit spt16 [Thamnocephalis sphaerospora]|uniref:FACT complex subunit n=1 Tax=Thamnocephalis sphaerospora TaxID=78915 RepID=A0A4P9XWG2_9FUNG|nr:FACT complex subunit spt16 [Thamnocephalis sphaerospora]|eukprot:RKP10675.1 FACT complex subunit spt16 [Thamnocephalis sphaerospora]